MKLRRVLSFACLFPALLFVACHKDSTPPNPAPPSGPDTTKSSPTVGSVNINLNNPGDATTAYEMVISEPGGKVLLDTIARYSIPVRGTLKTNVSLMDMTFIDTARGYHTITIYKSVNPALWQSTPLSYEHRGHYKTPSAQPTAASVLFTHFPAGYLANAPYFDTYFSSYGSGGIGFLGPTEDIATYQHHPGIYNYLVLYELGLYRLYLPTRDIDTIDLTHMDTALTFNFTKTSSWKPASTNLYAVPDSGDRSLDLRLYDGNYSYGSPKADLVYPKEPMQAYELDMYSIDANNNVLGFYFWGKNFPTSPLVMDASYINVINRSNDDLAVTFKGPVTYYNAGFGNKNQVSLFVIASTDSAVVKPITTLNNQHCKWLTGINYNDVIPGQIAVLEAPGFTYSSYMQYTTDSVKVQSHQLNFASVSFIYF